MNPVLQKNIYLIKEKVGIFKAANNYDIYDPATNTLLMECREPHLGLITKLFRFTDYKRMTPFHVVVTAADGQTVLTVKRGFSLILSKVEVFDENDKLVGFFKQKLFSIGGKFDVLNPNEEVICTLKGKWTSWDFGFIKNDKEIAHVSKKWSGLGKEFFTSADNYILDIKETVPPDNKVRILLFAAVMCIDMVLKE